MKYSLKSLEFLCLITVCNSGSLFIIVLFSWLLFLMSATCWSKVKKPCKNVKVKQKDITIGCGRWSCGLIGLILDLRRKELKIKYCSYVSYYQQLPGMKHEKLPFITVLFSWLLFLMSTTGWSKVKKWLQRKKKDHELFKVMETECLKQSTEARILKSRIG